MWVLFHQATTFNCRPSELLAIDDEISAYFFDSAVALFGTHLKHLLESVEGEKESEIIRKRERILAEWIPEASPSKARRFRDPAKET